MKNYRFDRTETDSNNFYNTERGTEPQHINEIQGFLKCKLIHSKNKSLIVPDLIYIMTDDTNFEWIQFYSFLPCMLTQFSEEEVIGSLTVDIAFGHILRLTISYEWHNNNLLDNSNLFECRIQGPKNIMDFTTGKGKLIEGIPYIALYHHTLPEYKELILSGNFFKCSAWNYQGTKELENYSYCYFSSLPKIDKSADLHKIAMSSNGNIHLIVDGTDEIIKLKVYRDSTENRTAIIEILIDSTIIENNHIWQHKLGTGQVYYEISNAFIYRVGNKVGESLTITYHLIQRQKSLKSMNYIIIGDACSKEGIIVPFDEEETEQIFKIESFDSNTTNLLKFWFTHGNQDHYTRKDIDKLKIKADNNVYKK